MNFCSQFHSQVQRLFLEKVGYLANLLNWWLSDTEKVKQCKLFSITYVMRVKIQNLVFIGTRPYVCQAKSEKLVLQWQVMSEMTALAAQKVITCNGFNLLPNTEEKFMLNYRANLHPKSGWWQQKLLLGQIKSCYRFVLGITELYVLTFA